MSINQIIKVVETEENAKVLNWEYKPTEEEYIFFLGKENGKRYKKHVAKNSLNLDV